MVTIDLPLLRYLLSTPLGNLCQLNALRYGTSRWGNVPSWKSSSWIISPFFYFGGIKHTPNYLFFSKSPCPWLIDNTWHIIKSLKFKSFSYNPETTSWQYEAQLEFYTPFQMAWKRHKVHIVHKSIGFFGPPAQSLIQELLFFAPPWGESSWIGSDWSLHQQKFAKSNEETWRLEIDFIIRQGWL